jgi:glycosyltransferase involved in cell wall biosynthesis
MPKVSVIIPTYNRAQYIAEAINSVLGQTYQDFEIIVIDDGSTDNTREVMENFKDPRVKYIYQENRRMSNARNAGINHSTGEYIAFLDSDDSFFEKAIEKGVQILDKHPEVSFCYGQSYFIDERGQILRPRRKGFERSWVRAGSEQIRDFFIHGNYISISAIARRSCLYEVGLFNPDFSSGSEDFDLWVRLAKRHSVAYIANPMYKSRIHSGAVSGGRKLDEVEQSNSRIFEGVFNDPEVGHLFMDLRPESYFHLYLRLASYACAGGEMKGARQYLSRAFKICPKGFFKSLWIPWLMQYGKTWIPILLLNLARRIRYLFSRSFRKISASIKFER